MNIIEKELKDTKIWIYTMTSDSGFAPHIKGGWLSLACCKPDIREKAKIGEWIGGIGGTTLFGSKEDSKLIFLMQVDETMSFDEYFHDKRFSEKKRADNIYKLNKEGKLIQANKANWRKEHMTGYEIKKDTDIDRVLLSKHFYYFGDKAIPLIQFKSEELLKPYRRYGHWVSKNLSKRIFDFVSSQYLPGIIGNPCSNKEFYKNSQIEERQSRDAPCLELI